MRKIIVILFCALVTSLVLAMPLRYYADTTIVAPVNKELNFELYANVTNTPPNITSSTLYDYDVVWTDPDTNTVASKTPAMSFFTNAGWYKLSVKNIEKINSISFYQNVARSFLKDINDITNIFSSMYGLTTAAGMLRGNSNSFLIKIPDFPVNFTGSMNAFMYGCSDVSCFLPDTIRGASDMANAFALCSNIMGTIPQWSTNLTSAYQSYYRCQHVTSSVPVFPKFTPSYLNTYLLYGDCYNITGSIPPWPTNFNGYVQYTYSNAKKLNGALPVWPSTFTNIMHLTYYGCLGVTGSIPEYPLLFNNNSISTYSLCTGLTGVIPSWPINYNGKSYFTYSSCMNVTGSVPVWPTGYSNEAQGVYSDCIRLSGSYPSFPSNMVNIYKTYNACYGMTDNTSTVANIFSAPSYPVLTNASLCFNSNLGLKGYASDFTSKVLSAAFVVSTSANSSSYRMFQGCTNLTDYSTLGAEWK